MSNPMKRTSKNLVDSADVGHGGTLSEVQTISCRFHDFENLKHEGGHDIESPILRCHGQEWMLRLYPGGDDDSDKKEVNVSVFLVLMSENADLKVKYKLSVGTTTDDDWECDTFNSQGGGKYNSFGYSEFAPRTDVLDSSKGYLDEHGTLEITADIRVYTAEPPVWRPKKRLHRDMLALLESEDFTDVTFAVDGTKFPAHLSIIKSRASTLASMADDTDKSEVEIADVKHSTFRSLLHFIYGDELHPFSDINRDARELLEASDRFGCSAMKLHVESEVVESVLSLENAADWVLFADAHSCALLKEKAVSIIVSNIKAVMASPGWVAVKESAHLLSEITEALVVGLGSGDDGDDVETMSISSLRKKVEERGLDADGTREMLVERLEKA